MLKPSGCEVKRTGCFENSGHLTALGVSDLPVNLFELLKTLSVKYKASLSLSVCFFYPNFVMSAFSLIKTYHFSTAQNADNPGGWQMPHLWWFILITHKDRYCEGPNMRTHACDDHTAHTHTGSTMTVFISWGCTQTALTVTINESEGGDDTSCDRCSTFGLDPF